MLYANDLTTMSAVNEQIGNDTGSTTLFNERSTVQRYIRQASVAIERACKRSFVPYQATHSFDRNSTEMGRFVSRRLLQLDTDLLSITTLTNANTDTISSSNYRLLPRNRTVKTEIELTRDGGVIWQFSNYDSAVSVAGVWGFHPYYSDAWNSAVTTLNNGGDLTSTATSMTVTDSSVLEELDYLEIDSEWLQVTNIDTSTHICTIRRGVNGTTASLHSDSTAIARYTPIDNIQLAATRYASWLYQNRGETGERIYAQGVAIIPDAAPPTVKEIVAAMARKAVFSI